MVNLIAIALIAVLLSISKGESTDVQNHTVGVFVRDDEMVLTNAGISELVEVGLKSKLEPQVFISYKNRTHICSATLVSHQHVVTAGKCILGIKPKDILLSTKIRSRDPDTIRRVKEIHFHPNYWPVHNLNNIAVIKLDKSFSQEKIKIAELAHGTLFENCKHIDWKEPSEIEAACGDKLANNNWKCMVRYGIVTCAQKRSCLDPFPVETGVGLLCEGQLSGVTSSVKCDDFCMATFVAIVDYKEWIFNVVNKKHQSDASNCYRSADAEEDLIRQRRQEAEHEAMFIAPMTQRQDHVAEESNSSESTPSAGAPKFKNAAFIAFSFMVAGIL